MDGGVAVDEAAGHVHGVDERVQRERLDRMGTGAGFGGTEHLALDRLDRADQAGGVVRQRVDGDGVRSLGVHQTGNLDDRVPVQHRKGAAVADVEDQGGAFVAGDSPHQGESHFLVATGQVLLLAVAGTGTLAVLGHVGGLAFGAGAVPGGESGVSGVPTCV